MNQFTNAWAFFFKNWKVLLPVSTPLFFFIFLAIFYLSPQLTPLLMAGQYDLINEFLENNQANISIIDVCFDLVFLAFIGALNIQFYNLTINKKPLKIFNIYSKSFSKILWLFVASFLSSLLIGIGFLLLVFPGVYLFARFSLFPIFIVIEDQGPISALKLSWENTDEYGGQLFFQTLVFFIAMLLVMILSSVLFSFMDILAITIMIFLEMFIFCIVLCYLYFSLYKSIKNL